MSSSAEIRLQQERKNWRNDHPPNFYAKPTKNKDNSTNMFEWEAGVPGEDKTDWEGGIYKIKLSFPKEYPVKPPTCRFSPPIYHPNVFANGIICLSILKQEGGWRAGISVKQILIGIQSLLAEPNINDPANGQAAKDYKSKSGHYARKIREQAKLFTPDT